MGLGLSLEEKVKRAIATFQMYEPEGLKRDPVNGYYLCDSYGKDSGVILHLAKASGVKFQAHHNLTTLDPPELIMHGRKNHPETIVHRPKMAMLTMLAVQRRGPPTRKVRWCCAEYKEGAGNEMVKVMGIRASESARRKAKWKIWQPNKVSNSWILNPILYWSDNDIWKYTRVNNVAYCSLYDEGKTRLGCIGCPMSPEQRIKDFQRWPRYEKLWKRSIEMFWNNWHGVLTKTGDARWFDKPRYVDENPWTCWQDLWKWWMHEMPKHEDENDCQMGLF